MATAAPVEKIDIGRVISRGFEALKANFVPFFLCSVVLAGAPTFAIQYLTLDMISSGSSLGVIDPGSIALITFGGLTVSLIAGMLLQGVVVRSTILTLSGRVPDVSQSIATALRLLLPLIGVAIMVGLATVAGFIFLIVPGIMIYCAYVVAVPALIEERRGVFDSMQRSRDLTRNSRKRIFVVLVVLWIFSVIISTIFNAISGTDPMSMSVLKLPNPILAGASAAIVAALTSVISAVVLAALYVELRTVKEGATTDDLAAIFE